MSQLLERIGGYFPSAAALGLPVVFIPILGDLYILPRASIVIAGACLGTGLALLTPTTSPLGAIRWPLVAAAAAAVLALAFSVSWPLSLAGSYTRYESLPTRLAYIGLLASTAWLVRTEGQRRVLVGAYVGGCSIAAIEALFMAYSHVPFRPDGNLGNANLLAALLVMALPLALDGARRASDWWLAAWAAAIVVLAAGLYVTTSRSGGLGAVAAVATLVLFSVPRRFVPHVAGAAAALMIASVRFVQVYLNRLNSDPAELRLGLWRDGLHLVAARPLTGWGEDTTGLVFGRYLSQDYATLVTFDRVHSGPLDLAAMQGVLGLAATGLVVAIVLVFAWRNRSLPGVGTLAAALVGYSVWVTFNFDWSPATGAFWLLAGALWSAFSTPRSAGRFGVGGRLWRPAVAILLALAAIPLAVLPILADAWYVQGRADLAARADPLQAQYHWAIGSPSELRAAASLGETDPGMYVELGDAELRLGDRNAARSAYERALEIDPFYTPASQRLSTLGGQ